MADIKNAIQAVTRLSPIKSQASHEDRQAQQQSKKKKTAKAKSNDQQTAETTSNNAPFVERRSGKDRRHESGKRGPWLESREHDRRKKPHGFKIEV